MRTDRKQGHRGAGRLWAGGPWRSWSLENPARLQSEEPVGGDGAERGLEHVSGCSAREDVTHHVT